MKNVAASVPVGLSPSLMPRLVEVLITKLLGVIGSKVDCGIKNSPELVNICKSRPDRIAFIELILSVLSVTSSASSARASLDLKLKKSPTLDPNNVLGSDLDPPKYNLPS